MKCSIVVPVYINEGSLFPPVEQLKTEVIPALKQSQSDFSPGNVRFYEGDDGVELALRDILDSAAVRRRKSTR